MAERENVVDFTVPYYDLVGLTILMKKPKFEYSLIRFLTVLDEAVWGCIIGAFFLFSILLSAFDRFSPFSFQNNKESWKGEGAEPRVFSMKEGIWFCMMSLTPQGTVYVNNKAKINVNKYFFNWIEGTNKVSRLVWNSTVLHHSWCLEWNWMSPHYVE